MTFGYPTHISRCEAGSPDQRVQACDGIGQPAASTEIECGAVGRGDSHTVEYQHLAVDQQIVAGDDLPWRTSVRPDQLDRRVIGNPFGAMEC